MKMVHTAALCAVGSLALMATAGCSEEPAPNEVPAGLAAIESTAEDAFDLALQGDVDGVRGRGEEMSTQWDAYRARAASDGVPAADIATLDAAIAALVTAAAGTPSAHELARITNAVSRPMEALYGAYDPPVPSEVLTLDYLGRELELDALEADFAHARADVDAIEAKWNPLRAAVIGAGGSVEAASFEASIRDERLATDASDAGALEAVAVEQLELVDGVEDVFGNAGDAPD